MRLLCILVLVSLLFGCGKKPVSFRDQIQPILNRKCVKCHGGENPPGRILLTSFDNVMSARTRKGKKPLVVSGNLAESWLYIRTRTDQPHFQMPPDTSGVIRLPENEQELLGKWILQGAHDN